tara:strand:+ start:152 stop:415 length:264 start_codon:yes stop_codon:yes gene_type:complete
MKISVKQLRKMIVEELIELKTSTPTAASTQAIGQELAKAKQSVEKAKQNIEKAKIGVVKQIEDMLPKLNDDQLAELLVLVQKGVSPE